MTNFFDAFEELNINTELKNLFSDVSVERINVSRVKKLAFIYCRSGQLLHYKQIKQMEEVLAGQVFSNNGFIPKLQIFFENMAQASLREILDKYEESIKEEIGDNSIVDFHEFCESPFQVEENKILISCEDNFFTKERSREVGTTVKNIVERRFGKEVEISFVAVEKKEKKKQRSEEPVIVTREQIQALAEVPEGVRGQVVRTETPNKKTDIKGNDRDAVKESTGNAVGQDSVPTRQRTEKKSYRRPKKDPDVFYGTNCEGTKTPIRDIQDEIGEVIVDGQILGVESREIKGEKLLIMFGVTDFTDSIMCKIFIKKDQAQEENIFEFLKKENFVRVKGIASKDNFSHEISIMSIQGIKEISPFVEKRKDTAKEKRVELHAHTKMSNMDGLTDMKALVKRAYSWGHKAVAITDHGVTLGFTDAFHALQGMKLPSEDPFKIIYGMEGYLVDDDEPTVWNPAGQSLRESFVVFDLETTGFSATSDQIIEIGAVKVVDGKICDRYSSFVKPTISIPERITELTGITDDMVKAAPEIETALSEFMEFAKGSILVAHNAGFDYGFIRKKGKSLGLSTEFTVVDTVNTARLLLPDLARYTLDRLAKALKLPSFNHHRAVDDAEETAMIFERFVEMLEKKEIDNLDKLAKWSKGAPEIIRKKPSYHIIILAANEVGRTNLYRLVSYSHLKYFARRPRIPRSLLEQYREGLIIGSACEAGELYKAVLRNEDEDRLNRLCEFYDYYEIQPIGNNFFMLESEKYPQIQTKADLQEINRKIVELGEKYQKLVVATCDVHFMDPEDAIYREIVQAGQGMKDEEQPPLYLHTTDEMLEEFSYLGREKAKEVVITNTNLVADMIEKIEPVYPDKAPPVIPNSDEILREICEAKAYSMYGNPLPPQVKKRLEHELDSIIRNGFAVMYIIAQKLVWKSNEDGYLVGSRGSVGSSFVATMSGITEVNPLPAHYYCEKCHYVDFDSEEVKKFAGSSGCDMPPKKCPNCGAELIRDGHDIPFETFLGFYGDKEPDIDLNFSGEYQSKAHNYTEVIFGAGQTFRAGTVGTLADKTAYGYVKKFYEEQGISKRNAEIERLLAGCTGVQRTTGQHPGGIIVLPMGWEIYTFTPVQHPANDMTTTTVTTHFDYHSIDHNLLKLDILGHDDPTMIRMLEDLTGIDAKTIPMDDEKVISLFDNTSALGVTPDDLLGCDLGSLGLPELGTDFVMQMLRDTKPKCFSDIVRISGLSHGTDVWLNNAQYFIKEGNCTLSTAICTRDDIMTFLIQIGVENGLAFKIMESVRKGKGLTEDMEAAMKEAGVEDWYIESCKRIKYMFPKAHAVAYVMMAFRIAYFKVYYPLAYYAAYFSIRAKAFNYEKMCMGKSQLESYMRDYKKRTSVQSGGLTQKEQDEYGDMKIVQEMYARGYSFLPIDIFKASAYDFQIMDDKLMPPFCTLDGMGGKAAEGIVEAVKDGPFTSRENFRNRSKVSATIVDKMGELGLLGDLPLTDQMSIMDFL